MQEKAFPNPHLIGETGMTLRDYFAAKAMAEMNWLDKVKSAKACYEYADAMLKAREQ
jgi:hypothetical protein